MAVYRLSRVQEINASLQEVWNFFSNPVNLKAITPGYMNFIITSAELPAQIYTGQLITYKVSPLLGIPLNWETEITDVEPLKLFVDNQRKGPYKLWRHTHLFEQKGDKVLMTDIVEYELPMGFIGTLGHRLWVKAQLQRILDFRFNKVEQLFPGKLY